MTSRTRGWNDAELLQHAHEVPIHTGFHQFAVRITLDADAGHDGGLAGRPNAAGQRPGVRAPRRPARRHLAAVGDLIFNRKDQEP